MAKSLSQNPIAEVLTSSITGLTAEACPQNKESQTPPKFAPAATLEFGSFVKIASPENQIDIFAVIFDVLTHPSDAVHKPTALGMSRDQLRLEQPHIFTLLKTQMQATIVGYQKGGNLYQHLPPQPPQVHDFVYEASPTEINTLTSNFDFLNLLVHVNAVPTDELIAAAIRCAARAKSDSETANAFLIEAGRAVSQIFRSDYERMLAIIKKIKPVV